MYPKRRDFRELVDENHPKATHYLFKELHKLSDLTDSLIVRLATLEYLLKNVKRPISRKKVKR